MNILLTSNPLVNPLANPLANLKLAEGYHCNILICHLPAGQNLFKVSTEQRSGLTIKLYHPAHSYDNLVIKNI